MENRIRHLLGGASEAPQPQADGTADLPAGHALPPGINMLTPVVLCINRELLVSLLSASIREIHRDVRALPEGYPAHELAVVEASLEQQRTFRAWARAHSGTYISIAVYPLIESDGIDDPDVPDES